MFHASVQQGLEKFKATFLPWLFICHLFLIICCVYAKGLMLVENEGGGSKYNGHNILTRPRSMFHASVQQGLEKFKATFLPWLCHLPLISYNMLRICKRIDVS